MKKIVLFFSLLAMLTSCSEEKTAINSEPENSRVLKNGALVTPAFTVDGDAYTLNYVKEHNYNAGYFCYGHLNLSDNKFQELIRDFLPNEDLTKIFAVNFFGESKEICDGDDITQDYIKSMLVYYKNSDGKAYMDFIKLSDGSKESYQISDIYATITMYFLYERSGITNNPSIIGVRNGDFDFAGAIFDDEDDMISYSVIPPMDDSIIHPGLDNGSGNPYCPLNCTNGPTEDCNSLSNCAGICEAKHITRELYFSSNHQNLSYDLFNKFGEFYAFRDFLKTTPKGRDYTVKYYALGRLVGAGEVNLSLSTMVKCANVVISHSGKLDKLIKHQNYGNDILFDQNEADEYKDLLYELKAAAPTKKRWNEILDGLIYDVEQYQGRTVSDIVQTF